jgi:hypothetical protein
MNWSTILFLSVLSGSAAVETLRVYIGTAQSDGIYFAELNTATGPSRGLNSEKQRTHPAVPAPLQRRGL